MTGTASWQDRYAVMATDWRGITSAERSAAAAELIAWDGRLNRMRECQRGLGTAGNWRGGPRTLLAALGVQYRELAMTAGLAWLLRPDGHHGLGSAFLDQFLARLGVHSSGSDVDVQVVVEEQRGDTRADLVVYGDTWTVVVEAKTFAGEQEEQLDRLHEHWQHEPVPYFVFLTRGVREMRTARRSSEAWQPLTWEQVALLIVTALRAAPRAAPGVTDYLTTLEAYHRV